MHVEYNAKYQQQLLGKFNFNLDYTFLWETFKKVASRHLLEGCKILILMYLYISQNIFLYKSQ